MTADFTDDQLRAYFDELLPAEQMAEVERTLRDSEDLRRRVAVLVRRRDQGAHSVGEIWRRNRVSCPSRGDLGGWLLGSLDDAYADYVEFHLREVGCRYCAANLADLEEAAQTTSDPQRRRRRFFQSSAGHLPSRE